MSEGTDSPPCSPQPQSDSDGSVSSSEGLQAQVAPVKCRWRLCGEWFGQLELLAAHVTHTHALPGRSGLFYCGWEGCSRGDRGFNARYKMLVHVRTHTNEKPHHCYQCDKSFSRAENLKIHSRSHTGERPYVCPIPGCGKAYSNSSDRFKHTRTHSVDKPYVCKVPGCSKRYTDPSSLRKHVKTYRHFPSSSTSESEFKMEVEKMEGKEAKSVRTVESWLRTESQILHPQEHPRERSWPGLLCWYGWVPPHSPHVCYEQETPLDLTLPVKLHHTV